jgi:hypothetical protein
LKQQLPYRAMVRLDLREGKYVARAGVMGYGAIKVEEWNNPEEAEQKCLELIGQIEKDEFKVNVVTNTISDGSASLEVYFDIVK